MINARMLVSAALVLAPVTAIGMPSTDAQVVYHCEYRVTKANGTSFVMKGNIVPSDLNMDASQYDSTYLTLEPPQISEVKISARILFTSDGYNPMTLHPRGMTTNPVASAVIKGDWQDLTYTDADGTFYGFSCKIRG